MEPNIAKQRINAIAVRDMVTFEERTQTAAWDRVYELAGRKKYTNNGICIASNPTKIEYWDGEDIDLTGLAVNYTGDNDYTSSSTEHDDSGIQCTGWNCDTLIAEIKSNDTVVDGQVKKYITIVADENPQWTAEVEITVKQVYVSDIELGAHNVKFYQNSNKEYVTEDRIEYAPAYSNGDSAKYMPVPLNSITVNTSDTGMTTATVTIDGITKTVTVEVIADNRIFVTSEYDSSSYKLSIQLDSNKTLPDGFTYEGGELLYHGEPTYICMYNNGEAGDYQSTSDTDLIALPCSDVYAEGFYGSVDEKMVFTYTNTHPYWNDGMDHTGESEPDGYNYRSYNDTGARLVLSE